MPFSLARCPSAAPTSPATSVFFFLVASLRTSASDQDAEVRKEATKKKKTDVAGLVGAALGQRAKEKGITAVVFDRGGFRYHGRVKALAEAVRKAGVTF